MAMSVAHIFGDVSYPYPRGPSRDFQYPGLLDFQILQISRALARYQGRGGTRCLATTPGPGPTRQFPRPTPRHRFASLEVPGNGVDGTLTDETTRTGIMATDRANDLRAFRDFIDEKLKDGGADMTLDEALGLWEVENQGDDERAATVRAVREALDDMRARDAGVPARDHLAELRRRHNLPERP